MPAPLPDLLVVHADCDLALDYQMRSENLSADEMEKDKRTIWQIQCVVSVDNDDVKDRSGRQIAKLFTNPVPRVHYMAEYPFTGLTEGEAATVGPYVFDLHHAFAIPADELYQGLAASAIQRIGIIPERELFSLLQRLHSLQSRVALPDPPQSC